MLPIDRERFAMAVGREFYRVAIEEFHLTESQAQRLRLCGKDAALDIIEKDEHFHNPTGQQRTVGKYWRPKR